MSGTDPGVGPSPIVTRVLDLARSKDGQRETGGPNRGPIVVWSLEQWVSADRLARYLETGVARWCAGFASRCWTEVWPDFRPVGSADCDVLWSRCQARGWTYLHDGSARPEPGDLLFFGNGLDKTHVEIVTGFSVDKQLVHTIAGNVGDRVARRQRAFADRTIYGWARPQPQEGV